MLFVVVMIIYVKRMLFFLYSLLPLFLSFSLFPTSRLFRFPSFSKTGRRKEGREGGEKKWKMEMEKYL